jgi:excisionase family DNA binding protein
MSSNRSTAHRRSSRGPVVPIHQNPVPLPRRKRVRSAERFLERRQAQALGHEVPLLSEEAAVYVGFKPKTMQRWARGGTIPAHPVSGVHRKSWRFYASELDAWLHQQVNSPRRPCSPDGKEEIK